MDHWLVSRSICRSSGSPARTYLTQHNGCDRAAVLYYIAFTSRRQFLATVFFREGALSGQVWGVELGPERLLACLRGALWVLG